MRLYKKYKETVIAIRHLAEKQSVNVMKNLLFGQPL